MSKKLNQIKRTPLDIWSKPSYSKSISENIKHMKRCIKWSNQRVRRGYCDSDVWDMFGFLQKLIPDMLQTFERYNAAVSRISWKNLYKREWYLL